MRRRHVLLLHGQPGAGSDWHSVVAQLPPTVAPLVLDRPGYRSSPHAAGDFRTNAGAMLHELDTTGVDEAVVVGHSYGGGVAVAMAAMAPERVSGLVLVASVGPGCLNNWDTLLAAPVAGPVCALAAWWLTPWFARARLARIARLRGRPLDDDEYVNWDVWGQARVEHGAMWRTFLTEQRALVHGVHDLAEDVTKVRAPTLVLADPQDTMIPWATAEALHAHISGSTLATIDGGGHHLPRRTPHQVAAAITGLLDELG